MNITLVTGATGKVGRNVVTQLLEIGAPVRALVRNPLAAQLPDGVEIVQGDLADPGSLAAALDGVESVFLVWPTLAADHAAAATIDAIAKHARRIVYVSAHGVPDDPAEKAEGIIGSHALIEGLIERSGMEWTFLRPTGFAGNTLGWAVQIGTNGVVRGPFAGMARSLIHERDIAAVGVHVLTGQGHAGAKYVITGPEAITQADQVRAIGEAIGVPARFDETGVEVARQELLAAWGDAAMVDDALAAWASMAEAPEIVTSTVRDLIGRPALPYRQWAIDHAADFRLE